MPTFPRHLRWAATFLLAVLTLTLSTACSKSTDDPPPTADATTSTSTPATTSVPTTAAPLTPEQEVEEAYLMIVDRYYRGFANPDPASSLLAEDFTGSALTAARSTAEALQDAGRRFRFNKGKPPVPSIISVEITDDRAVVRNCIIDDGILFDDVEGVLDDSVSSSLLTTGMIRVGTVWKVNSQAQVGKWEDSKGCDR